ncbi:MAG TPA: TIGR02530 family flagellar biosynthesis protein [Solirubrobacteraceae bacterium]|jgi:flagellar operon protein|nr:TIGR02530 family flagellar biosynthesis protein [Solirubrobacteraceae bacterium]
MSPISNPALVPPGGLATPVVPAGARGKSGASVPADGKGATPGAGPTQGVSFADALKQADHSQQLQFSKHALARVQRRGIELDSATLGRLSQGVQRAASKGSRDSLVLVDGTAFVVSVNNRTVITAVGSEHMKDNVFTNIDSAVIA